MVLCGAYTDMHRHNLLGYEGADTPHWPLFVMYPASEDKREEFTVGCCEQM